MIEEKKNIDFAEWRMEYQRAKLVYYRGKKIDCSMSMQNGVISMKYESVK